MLRALSHDRFIYVQYRPCVHCVLIISFMILFNCITDLNIICDEEPSISLQNVIKTCRGVFFFYEVIGQPPVVLLKIRLLHLCFSRFVIRVVASNSETL